MHETKTKSCTFLSMPGQTYNILYVVPKTEVQKNYILTNFDNENTYTHKIMSHEYGSRRTLSECKHCQVGTRWTKRPPLHCKDVARGQITQAQKGQYSFHIDRRDRQRQSEARIEAGLNTASRSESVIRTTNLCCMANQANLPTAATITSFYLST